MPSLQVREVPVAVYGALSEASRQEHRSLAQQTIVTLERGLGFDEEPRQRRQRVLAAIQKEELPAVGTLPSAAELIREDRDR